MKAESMRENVTKESLKRTIDRNERIKKAKGKIICLNDWLRKWEINLELTEMIAKR